MPTNQDSNDRREVVLGKVSGLFGVKGWVKVHSYTEPRDSILQFRRWVLLARADRRVLQVAEGRKHGKSIVVRFEGIDDRDAAAELLDLEIGVPRENLPKTAADEYYWTDLEGMQVVHCDGRLLGRVAYLLATGANDVLVVQGDEEILVPFVAGRVIRNVDMAKGVISVDWEWG
ncbi:MAG: ribosome maturation factor RimM [Woeseiaceae bacterium]